MRRSITRALSLLLATLLGCSSAQALPTVRKYPTGPWVSNVGGVFSVPAGQPIDWLVRVCNDTTRPLSAQVTDFVHSGDCQNHDYLTLLCPPVDDAGGSLTACGDGGLGTIDLTAIVIPVNTCAEVIVRTTVDLLTPRAIPGGVCNVAFYQTDSGTPDGSGQTSPPSGNSGCSCVEILAALPTQLDFTLTATPDAPPLLAGDPASTLVYGLEATNLTPRDVLGRVLFPIPPEVDFVEVLECPTGATCDYFAGTLEIAGLVLPEGGSFSARLRVAPNCGSVTNPEICAQAEFLPLENPGAVVPSDDRGVAGQQRTCVHAVAGALRIDKRWRLENDVDGDGVPSIGDRIRYLVELWNAGDGAARAVNVVDNLPLGLDATTAVVDPRGTYDSSRRQGVWTLPDVGPGSVVDLWMDATISGSSVAPNRARLTTQMTRACNLALVLSDDPAVAGASDATSITGVPSADVSVEKSWTFSDLDGSGGPDIGEPVSWLVEIRNRGAGVATDARLDDALGACWRDLPGLGIEPVDGGVNASTPRSVVVTGLGGADGLQPDEIVRVRFTLVPVDVAACCNSATVTWAAGARAAVSTNPGALAGSDGPSCLSPTEAAVSLSKFVALIDSNGNGLAESGERLHYTLGARSDAGGVSDAILADEIPAGLTVDPASITTVPPSLGFSLLPAPAGVNGAGRIEVRGLGLSVGGTVSLDFEGIIDAGTSGTLCNIASLVVPGLREPFLSSDGVTGGASCIDIVQLDPPILGVTVTADPAIPTGCLLPGADVEVTASYSISSGGASARGVVLDLLLPAGAMVVDADGGVEAPGLVSWSLGDQPAGASGSFTVIVTLPCEAPSTYSFSVSLAAANAAATSAGPASVTSAASALGGSVSLTHGDTNGDGDLDPGEILTATLTMSELLGCDAGVLVASLDAGSLLDIVTISDGGGATGSIVAWSVPSLSASQSVSVSVDLSLSATAPSCSQPVVPSTLTWALAAPACLAPISLALPDVSTPPGDCTPLDPIDLLREDAVSTLQPPSPMLATILDSSGVDDSCTGGTTTRIAAGRVYAAAVSATLGAGISVIGDALLVGQGQPGNLVFYEVSHSCAVIRACRIDADGNTGNGMESVLITSGTCP